MQIIFKYGHAVVVQRVCFDTGYTKALSSTKSLASGPATDVGLRRLLALSPRPAPATRALAPRVTTPSLFTTNQLAKQSRV